MARRCSLSHGRPVQRYCGALDGVLGAYPIFFRSPKYAGVRLGGDGFPFRPLSEVRAAARRLRRCGACVRSILASPSPLSTSRESECAGFAISPIACPRMDRISLSQRGRRGGSGDWRRIYCAAFVKGLFGHAEESRSACLWVIRAAAATRSIRFSCV